MAYNTDYHAWTRAQADALRRRSANDVDWDNVDEEIESLGNQQAAELYNRYVVLLSHLLKWIAQPERRSRSWSATISEQRRALNRHLKQNPSLKAVDPEEFAEAYAAARLRASGETDLDIGAFPEDAPFTADEARDLEWWPPESPGAK